MTDEDKKRPIIVVKKKGAHEGHHGGAWKVAYADFVTAMMAFFLVMWLVSQSDKVKEGVGGYFRDPVGFSDKAGKGVFEGGNSAVKDLKSELVKRREAEKQVLESTGQKIREAISNSPDMAKLKDFVEIEMTPEGLRIQLIDAATHPDSSNFFDLGSAKLKARTSVLLEEIAADLGALPNHIIVEGHTDSKPYTGRTEYSNWELSADRANSARRLMESSGLRPKQIIEIRGQADSKPKIAENPEDPRNRRVAIIVLNEEHDDRIKDIEVGSELAVGRNSP